MCDLLKKVVTLLAVAVIMMFLVAAGIDDSSIQVAEVISRSVLDAVNHYYAMVVLFSAWLFTVGLMCRTLNRIPGIRSDRSNSRVRAH